MHPRPLPRPPIHEDVLGVGHGHERGKADEHGRLHDDHVVAGDGEVVHPARACRVAVAARETQGVDQCGSVVTHLYRQLTQLLKPPLDSTPLSTIIVIPDEGDLGSLQGLWVLLVDVVPSERERAREIHESSIGQHLGVCSGEVTGKACGSEEHTCMRKRILKTAAWTACSGDVTD